MAHAHMNHLKSVQQILTAKREPAQEELQNYPKHSPGGSEAIKPKRDTASKTIQNTSLGAAKPTSCISSYIGVAHDLFLVLVLFLWITATGKQNQCSHGRYIC